MRVDRRALVSDLLHVADVLGGAGFLPATDGNFSARLDGRRILLTTRGIEKRTLTEKDLVEIDLDEERPEGGSTEWAMHRMLYLRRPEVCCVLHVHSPSLTAHAAAHRVPRIEVLAETYITVGPIALVPFVAPGTPQVGEALINADPSANVYLLSNHGAVAVGRNVRETLHRIERAEFLAQVELNSALIGGAQSLSPNEITDLK